MSNKAKPATLTRAQQVATERAKLDNVAFIDHLISFSRRGPLMQVFILEGVRKYAEACAAADPAVFDSPMLNGAAWHDCAKELCEAFEAREARR